MINGSVITVCGNLTFEPTTREIDQDTSVTEIKIASTTRRRTRAGVWEDSGTTFFRVSCWSRLGERVARSLHKGDAVVVVGRFQVSEWEDKDGGRHQSFDINADVVGPDLNKVEATVHRPARAPLPVGESAATYASTSAPTGQATADTDPWTSEYATPASEPAA